MLLAVAFRERPEVIAAAWGVLAFGDGLATVIGRSWGRLRLSWNPEKSWAGSLGYWMFGTLAAGTLLWWSSPDTTDVALLWGVSVVVVLGSALLESLPLKIDDNLIVPLLTGLGFALALGW